ncbi:DUF1294 domain-containing protein [Anaerococcus sp. AGMB00486]|uniref:DUF1294 domain-containing protein n=2 Tax=Anaerococcus TaxID=165779 RepID=A0ABX2N6X3_9FIRM|nr:MULTISPECIES: DUF1294 domain-containing protein [Anaerococcus]MDY3005972.1 DUF1294 domain-containing protein [Anaerococcus porci]MSS77088.1 DUF1294 domain-containing protein [Anaerococcus porci]NVF10420.1 DUF1294 domain-containing protein [Anaerococcus faecalis]
MFNLGILIYLLIINLFSINLTCYDKIASKKIKRKRIKESKLLTIAFLGGALSMYILMRLIHHKTKHKNFMILLPIFTLIHLFIILILKTNHIL